MCSRVGTLCILAWESSLLVRFDLCLNIQNLHEVLLSFLIQLLTYSRFYLNHAQDSEDEISPSHLLSSLDALVLYPSAGLMARLNA